MVKQRDQHGRLEEIKVKAVWGNLAELLELLGKSTAYIERSHLTARLFNARLTRKTLAFSKNLELHEAAVIWEDAYYNWIRPYKCLRIKIHNLAIQKWSLSTPGMAASLTDHIWTGKELFYSVPLPSAKNTC